jgi:F-type H+-transporting ATPase subunit a
VGLGLWQIPNISIAPDVIIPGTFITNTLLCTWLAIICLVVVFYFGTRRRDLIPSGLQNAIEWAVELLQNMVEGVAGKAKGKKFFPFVATFFFFILICNLIDILPGIDTVGTMNLGPGEHATSFFLIGKQSTEIIPWFRPPTTDLNLTLAMALVSVVVTQYMGFAALGATEQISKYLNFKALTRGGLGFIDFIVGVLEIVSELGRLISFSFRLFGNIFAGSVLLAVFAFLVPFLATLIFIPFEIFVAVIQAYVFAFLTLLFMTLGTSSHAQHDENVHEEVKEYEAREQTLTASAH